MKYLLVTGYYPSENSALKVLENVKPKVETVRIKQIDDCFCVVLRECKTYEEADVYFSKFMKAKVYCGIHIAKDE